MYWLFFIQFEMVWIILLLICWLESDQFCFDICASYINYLEIAIIIQVYIEMMKCDQQWNSGCELSFTPRLAFSNVLFTCHRSIHLAGMCSVYLGHHTLTWFVLTFRQINYFNVSIFPIIQMFGLAIRSHVTLITPWTCVHVSVCLLVSLSYLWRLSHLLLT